MGDILIAFERESEQSAVEQLLAGRGHQVRKAANGLVALDTARREPPDLIVSDIVLPRMDGFALCRKWKQDEKLQHIPFIFYTRRHDDPKYERFALELGAARFLARSVAPEALATAVDELLAAAPAPQAAPAATPAAFMETGAHQARIAERTAQQQQAQAEALARVQQAHARLRQQVAELEAANERLAASESRFRRLFDANAVPMWIVDHQTQGFIAVNDSALALYGYTRQEFLALKASALTAGDEAGLVRHRRKDGSEVLLALNVQEIDFDGRRAELVSAFNLTDRAALEKQLREQASAAQQALAAQRLAQRPTEFVLDLFKQSETSDEAALVARLVDQALDLTDSSLAFCYFVDEGAGSVTLAAWRERGKLPATAANEERALAQTAPLAECVRAKRALASEASAQLEGLPELKRHLVAPMSVDGKIVGLLGVANRETAYSENDLHALAALAEGAARVLQSKRAYARTLVSLQRTDVALHGMIDSFVRMIERHDPYTGGSSRRVAALAVAIAREIGLDGERQHGLRIAALLHDIGNIVVPATLLAKPAPLTETEHALMRTHVEEGCQLLAEIDFGAPVADIIYQHHERYDGSGYPRGIKGEEIMLEARILAIADSVEAMCSPRPYRPAVGMDAAIDEINRNAGRLYDPKLVEACTRLVRQHGFVLPE